MGLSSKFRHECLVHSYKQASGKIKSTSILHKPSGMRVERFFGPTDGMSYNNTVLDDLFLTLKKKVDSHMLRKAYDRGTHG